jgi:hypothetical protein
MKRKNKQKKLQKDKTNWRCREINGLRPGFGPLHLLH